MAFLERKGLLNNTQHGFRSGRSCLSALLNVFDNLMNMIDSSTTVDMIYLDFSKAFDKVDHGIVLHKLRDLGITGNLGVWFHQFLYDRTQFVRLPGGVSKDSPVLSGVVVCLLQPSSSVNSGCPGPESSVLVSSRWACPISSQVTGHWGELRNRTGELHPVDPFHSLDILKNHFASVTFCRNSGVYNVQNGAVIELSFVVSVKGFPRH